MNSLQFNFKSFTTSTMSFSLPIDDVTKPIPYEYRDPYTYKVGNKIMFEGTISRCVASLSGGTYSCDVEVSCPWTILTKKVYKVPVTWQGWAEPKMMARGCFGSWDNPSLKYWLGHVLDYASIAHRMEFGDVPFVPFTVTGETCEQILLRMFKFCPDMTSFWDFSSGAPTLVLSRSKQPMTINCKDYLVSSCSVEQSPLPIKGVKITYDWIGSDGVERRFEELAGDEDEAMEIELNDGNSGGPKEDEVNGDPNVGQHQSPTNQQTLQKMTVKGIPVPTPNNDASGKKFWVRANPELEGLKLKFDHVETLALDYDGVLDDEGKAPKNYIKKLMPYILVEGSLSTMTRGIKWCKNIIKQKIYCEEKMNKKLRALFPLGPINKPFNVLSATFVGMTKLQMTYVIGSNYSYEGAGDDEPGIDPDPVPPPDPAIPPDRPIDEIVKSIWEGQKMMGWSGSITIEDTDLELAYTALKSKINVSGMDKRWETMNGLVQTVDYDAHTRTTTISFGLPDHVEIGDMADNQSLNKIADETAGNIGGSQSGSFPPSGSGSWERKQGENPVAPSISGGINSASIPPAVVEIEPGGFACRVLTDGSSSKLQSSGGLIIDYDGNQKEVTPRTEWKTIKELQGSGEEVWLNITCSNQGAVTSATLDATEKGNTLFRPKEKNGEIQRISIKLAQANSVAGSDPPEYTIIQEHIGNVELSRVCVEEQDYVSAPSDDSYGGVSGLFHDVKKRTIILKKIKGDEGIRIENETVSNGKSEQEIKVKLVKADSSSSTSRLGGVNSISVSFVPLDSSEQSRIEDGQIKIFIPKETDSNDLSW